MTAEPRTCPDNSGECLAPKRCRKTKPCVWLAHKKTHEIIAGLAAGADAIPDGTGERG